MANMFKSAVSLLQERRKELPGTLPNQRLPLISGDKNDIMIEGNIKQDSRSGTLDRTAVTIKS